MELLQRFVLPQEFRPIVDRCNEIEKNILIEFKCLSKMIKNDYNDVIYNLMNEAEFKDDVEFIIRMQNECDIAIDTPKEIAEWYYTFATIQTIENFNKCCNEYNQYTNSIKNYCNTIITKIKTIKYMILNRYKSYIYETPLNLIDSIIYKLKDAKFNINQDFVWLSEDEL